MKRCVKCKSEKEKERFSKRKLAKDGLHPYCKECVSIIMKVYGQSETVKKRAKEWKNNNPLQVKIHSKKTYEKNKENWKEKRIIYNNQNRQIINEKQRKYNEKNRDKINAKQNAYLATEYGNKYSLEYYYKTKKQFRIKRNARNQLRYAVRVGKLSKPEKCEKCFETRKLHGHHADYNKPLQVIWVCNFCHKNIHLNQGN